MHVFFIYETRDDNFVNFRICVSNNNIKIVCFKNLTINLYLIHKSKSTDI